MMYSISKQREMIEEAAEFGERFPDVSDIEVYEHIEYVFELPPIPCNTTLALAIMGAYQTHDVSGGERWLNLQGRN